MAVITFEDSIQVSEKELKGDHVAIAHRRSFIVQFINDKLLDHHVFIILTSASYVNIHT